MKSKLSFWTVKIAVASLVGLLAMPSDAAPIADDEYIPYHPTGCRFVKKNQDGSFSFVQPCVRGMAGEWQQLIEVREMATPGVIFIPRQTLVNQLDVEGFWCSGAAPSAFKERFQECTEFGWQKGADEP
jgi:hypothetical protein